MDKSITEKIENTNLFLEYLESQGFNANHYEQILELNQDVLGSISLFLKDCQQFLLSKKIDYSLMHEVGINGAFGYVEKDGIFIPKTLESDEHFFGEEYLPKVPYKRHGYSYPQLNEGCCEYDATISKGISKEDNFDRIIQSNMDVFVGDIMDTNTEHYRVKRVLLLKKLMLIQNNNDSLKINIDKDSKNDKEFFLLSRKR